MKYVFLTFLKGYHEASTIEHGMGQMCVGRNERRRVVLSFIKKTGYLENVEV